MLQAGCDGDEDKKKDGGEQDCVEGESIPCECAGGKSSTRVCLSDGHYTECLCLELADTCTTPGEQSDCECPNGIDGVQVCRENGTLSNCICTDDLPACCDGRGSCFPSDAVPEEAASELGRDSCQGDDLLCVPDVFLDPAGVTLKVCHSFGGAEGRCLPECLPEIAEQNEQLTRDVCPAAQLCAPCLDPFTGYWTGSCGLFEDQGPREPPVVFDRCCNQQGHCLPTELVPEDQVGSLGEDTCPPGQGFLCVPKVFIDAGGDYVPEICRSIAGNEGRCLPDCLPDVADQVVSLPQDVCQEGFSCAPCFDPYTGESTGSCELGGDSGSTTPPVVFQDCCQERGFCVPADLVPADQSGFLGTDTCKPDQELCVPSVLTQPGYVPPRCRSVGHTEGRCLPDCLPEVQQQPVDLPRDTCDEHFACVPCYDPFDGSPTGACELEGDNAREPPILFDRCCNGIGFCLPNKIIPVDQLNCLDEGTCRAGQGLLCTPEVLTTVEPYLPEYCRSIGGAEGRCLPACLPDITSQPVVLPQDICPDHFVCGPYYDPTNGEVAGTCELPADPGPTEEPLLFDKCCRVAGRNHGTCVPDEALPEQYRGLLPRVNCRSSADVCVPDTLMPDPEIHAPSCMAVVNINVGGYLPIPVDAGPVTFETQGGCVPECLLSDNVNAIATRTEDCEPGEKCVVCEILNGIVPGSCG
jgi:hypothetical protein